MILTAVLPTQIRWSGKLHVGRRRLWKRLRAQTADRCSKISIAFAPGVRTQNHVHSADCAERQWFLLTHLTEGLLPDTVRRGVADSCRRNSRQSVRLVLVRPFSALLGLAASVLSRVFSVQLRVPDGTRGRASLQIGKYKATVRQHSN